MEVIVLMFVILVGGKVFFLFFLFFKYKQYCSFFLRIVRTIEALPR